MPSWTAFILGVIVGDVATIIVLSLARASRD
jgi:hypothetical protein